MRLYIKFFLLVFGIGVFFNSCTKESDNEISVKEGDLREDTLVSIVKVNAFAQSVNIDILGRKPLDSEVDDIVKRLTSSNSSKESRKSIIKEILGTDEYFNKLYLYNVSEYLNGADQNTINNQRLQFEYIKQLAIQDNNIVLQEFAQGGINNLDSVIVIPERLKEKTFSEDEMQKRLTNNAIYDDINMGVPNFTFSVFESFLFRAPTNQEWENSQNMCNTVGGVLFGINGQTKPDFLDIVFASDHYYEGRVINAYLRFLERVPTSLEQYESTVALIKNKDFETMYLNILSSDEYFER